MNKSKSSLFLMEILISILLFSLTSAVCIQVFVHADQMNKSSKELAGSIQIAQNLAEIMKSSPEPMNRIKQLYPNAQAGTNQLTIYFNKEFTSCTPEADGATFCSTLQFSQNGDMNTMNIQISNIQKNTDIYALKVSKYWGLSGGVL